MLLIDRYTKLYGKKVAVDNLSLHIKPGEIYGFIGHNGAGKTTTLKACAGILNFEYGNILIDGISIKEKPMECKKKMAYIPDNPDLYGFLTGAAYLNFIADIYKVPLEIRNKRIEDFADKYGIIDDLGMPINSYSHGMRQKIAIISALIHEPKILILDEPFVGLDPKATFELKNIMKEMTQKGCTIFFSTHVLDVAEKLCNKIAIIHKGKLVTCGNTDTVKGTKSLEEFFMEVDA